MDSVTPATAPSPRICVTSPVPTSPTPTWKGTNLNATVMSRSAVSTMKEVRSGGRVGEDQPQREMFFGHAECMERQLEHDQRNECAPAPWTRT